MRHIRVRLRQYVEAYSFFFGNCFVVFDANAFLPSFSCCSIFHIEFSEVSYQNISSVTT